MQLFLHVQNKFLNIGYTDFGIMNVASLNALNAGPNSAWMLKYENVLLKRAAEQIQTVIRQ